MSTTVTTASLPALPGAPLSTHPALPAAGLLQALLATVGTQPPFAQTLAAQAAPAAADGEAAAPVPPQGEALPPALSLAVAAAQPGQQQPAIEAVLAAAEKPGQIEETEEADAAAPLAAPSAELPLLATMAPQLFASAAWVALGLPARAEPAPAPVSTTTVAATAAAPLPTTAQPATAAPVVAVPAETQGQTERGDKTAPEWQPPVIAQESLVDAAPGTDIAAPSLPLKGEPRQWQQPLLQALGDRLQLQIATRSGGGSEEAQIRLDPPQLGRVEIAIRQQGGELQVRIAASHGEVLQQIQQVSEQLRQDLVQRHSGEVSVQVQQSSGTSAALRDESGRGARDGQAQQQQGQQQAQDQQQRRPGRALAEEQQAAETAAAGRFGRAFAAS